MIRCLRLVKPGWRYEELLDFWAYQLNLSVGRFPLNRVPQKIAGGWLSNDTVYSVGTCRSTSSSSEWSSPGCEFICSALLNFCGFCLVVGAFPCRRTQSAHGRHDPLPAIGTHDGRLTPDFSTSSETQSNTAVPRFRKYMSLPEHRQRMGLFRAR